ncbi:MAG: cytochrome c, partial [Planctomycetota bacterium]
MSAAPSVLTATPAMSSSGAPGPDASAARRKWRIGRVELGLFALLYAGLCGLVLVAYVVARVRDPALFAWGQHLLSPQRGLWLLAVLPAGGVALLAARHFAGRGQFRRAAAALGITVLAGGAFLVVCGIDYDSKVVRRLVPGKRFKPNERYVAWRFGVRLPRDWRTARAAPVAVVADAAAAPPAKREVSAAHGRELFLRVCASCHGVRGEGLIGSGKELRANEFVAAREDGKLVEFLKTGRQPWDPDNTTKVQMPARGGDPRVTDDDLRDVVAYLREMQKRGAA